MFILLYHQISEISEASDPLRLAVPPGLFEQEMTFLKNSGYQCLPLEMIAMKMSRKETLPENAFAITFDDGYQDNFDNALPILKRVGFTATIFLVPSRVGLTTKWEGLLDAQAFVLMDWDTVRRMNAEGIDFGSHTHTHAMLPKCTQEQVKKELLESKISMEKQLGKPAKLFAFPYEKAEPALQQAVQAAGYIGACGSLLYPENEFNLWRTECNGADTLSDFQYKISNAWRKSVEFKYHNPIGKSMRFFKKQIQRLGGGRS